MCKLVTLLNLLSPPAVSNHSLIFSHIISFLAQWSFAQKVESLTLTEKVRSLPNTSVPAIIYLLMKSKGTEMCKKKKKKSCTASYVMSQSSGSGPELAHAAGVNMVLVPAQAECQSGGSMIITWRSTGGCFLQYPHGNHYSLISSHLCTINVQMKHLPSIKQPEEERLHRMDEATWDKIKINIDFKFVVL